MNNANRIGALSLFLWTAKQLPLGDALEAAQRCFPDGAVGQLYSAAACRLALYRDGVLRDERNTQLDTGSIFEARIFAQVGELRWWYDVAEGHGRAAYLSESDTGPPGWTRSSNAELRTLRRIENHYLLWGEPDTGGPTGWTQLSSERIGALTVPIDGLSPHQRVRLLSYEYIGQAPGAAGERHGNQAVAAERLVRLEPYAPEMKPPEEDTDE